MVAAIQHLEIDGKRYVLLAESDFESLCGRAGTTPAVDDFDLPPFPKPDRNGRYPAEQYARISLARDLIRSRRSNRLTQQQLAKLAGIRQETLSRIETGKHRPSISTVEKIDKALTKYAMVRSRSR